VERSAVFFAVLLRILSLSQLRNAFRSDLTHIGYFLAHLR
jgi:hypothetical protein